MTAPTLTYQKSKTGVSVDLDRLVASRMLIQANSGGGKSRAIRQLLEQTHGRVQHIVLDPEGEFATLREQFDYVLFGKEADFPAVPKAAKLTCRRLVELGASAVIDLYDLSLQERREFVKLFLTELMALPRTLWHPVIVVIDEAHLFVPERGSGESQATESVIALCTQGRKRGYCAVLATQRISKLHKDAAAELLNKLIGRTGLDVDMKRAGDELGLDKDGRRGLAQLKPGEFYAYGPAIAPEIQVVRTGDVTTTHPEAGKLGAAPPPAPAKVRAVLKQLVDLPKEAEEEARTIAELQAQLRDAQARLRKVEKSGVERIVEKLIVDERAIARAVADERAQAKQRLTLAVKDVRGLVHRLGSLATAVTDLTSLGAALQTMAEGSNGSATPGTLLASTEHRPNPSSSAMSQSGASARTNVAPAGMQGETAGRDRQALSALERVSRPQQRMLNAVASLAALGLAPAPRTTVAALTDQSPRSSGWDKNLSTLRTAGLISYPDSDTMVLTDMGHAWATADATITSLADLHAAWRNIVSGPQWRMLEALIGVYPDAMDRGALAAKSGQSFKSSGWDKNLSTLRTLGLISYPSSDEAVATKLLMPEGLR